MGSQKGYAGPSLGPWALLPPPMSPPNRDMGTVPTQLGDTKSCPCGLGVSPGLTLSTYKLHVWEQ